MWEKVFSWLLLVDIDLGKVSGGKKCKQVNQQFTLKPPSPLLLKSETLVKKISLKKLNFSFFPPENKRRNLSNAWDWPNVTQIWSYLIIDIVLALKTSGETYTQKNIREKWTTHLFSASSLFYILFFWNPFLIKLWARSLTRPFILGRGATAKIQARSLRGLFLKSILPKDFKTSLVSLVRSSISKLIILTPLK